jgi:PAS domain S-box-containing protein
MQTHAILQSMIARAADPALIVDESGTILFAGDQACRVLKYATGELHGLRIENLIPVRYRLAHIGHRLRFTDNRHTRPMGAGLELFALCKDGSERRVDISLNPVQRGLETLTIVTIKQLPV